MVSTHLKISQIGSFSPNFRDDSSTKSLTATTTKPTTNPKKKPSPNLSIKGCSRSWLLWSPPYGKKHPQVVVESVVEKSPGRFFRGEKTSRFWKIFWWGWSRWWHLQVDETPLHELDLSICTCWFTLWDPESEVFDKNGGSFFNYLLSVNWICVSSKTHPTSNPAPKSPGPMSDPFDAGWPISDSSECLPWSPKRSAFRANWAQRRHQMIPWECWNLPVLLPRKRTDFSMQSGGLLFWGLCRKNWFEKKNKKSCSWNCIKVLATQCFGDTPMCFRFEGLMTIPTIRKQWEFRPQHIQPTKASLCWKAAVFCRTRRVVGSSDASPLFGGPDWHFGNVRRGNRISGSHSRQQITTSRREMTWNDSKPWGQVAKQVNHVCFNHWVHCWRTPKQKNVITCWRLKICSTIERKYFKKKHVQLHLFWRLATMATGAWWSFLRFEAFVQPLPGSANSTAAQRKNGKTQASVFQDFHPSKGWKNPHVQQPKSLNLPGRVSSNLYHVLGDRVLKIQRGND